MKGVAFNRETLIALRARREAQQIARAILLPHVDLPEPVLPYSRPLAPDPHAPILEPREREPLISQFLAGVFCFLCVLMLIYVATHKL